jgi:hypothetical protein
MGSGMAALVIFVLGILTTAQQVAVLNFLGLLPSSRKARQVDAYFDRHLAILLSQNGSRYFQREKNVLYMAMSAHSCRPLSVRSLLG